MPSSNERSYNFYEEVPVEPEPAKAEPVAEVPADDGGQEPTPVEEPAEPDKKNPLDQPVPFSRFQKTRNELEEERKAKVAAEARVAELEAANKPADKSEPEGDDEIGLDENSRKAVLKFLKSDEEAQSTLRDLGFVSRSDLERDQKVKESLQQFESDKTELTEWSKAAGYPEFNAEEVDKWADENLGKGFVKSKKTLKAAYVAMNEETILDAERKKALAGGGTNQPAIAERPGSGARPVVQDDVDTRNPIRSRIRNAMNEIKNNT